MARFLNVYHVLLIYTNLFGGREVKEEEEEGDEAEGADNVYITTPLRGCVCLVCEYCVRVVLHYTHTC